MAQSIYAPDLTVVTVNGRQITQWGQTADPITHTQISQPSTLIQGQGGDSARVNMFNPGRNVSLFVLPGSSDSAYLQGLKNSRANITMGVQFIGTTEIVAATEGMITGDGTSNRGGGATVGDDQYDFAFNVWTENKGGD